MEDYCTIVQCCRIVTFKENGHLRFEVTADITVSTEYVESGCDSVRFIPRSGTKTLGPGMRPRQYAMVVNNEIWTCMRHSEIMPAS